MEVKELVQLTEKQQIVVESRQVAEDFEKKHKHVIEAIESYQKDVPNFRLMFEQTTYLDSYGRKQKQYLMNRDGFSLLAMGFTGKKALEWKLKYIDAFNRMESELNSDDLILARALTISNNKLQLQNRTIKELRTENKIKDQQIAELKPKAGYYDVILSSTDSWAISIIAKDYGMSPQRMNKLLKDLKVQYKQGNAWLLYQKHATHGYTETTTIPYKKQDGTFGATPQMRWTQKGRLFIYDLLKAEGILPLIEMEEENEGIL